VGKIKIKIKRKNKPEDFLIEGEHDIPDDESNEFFGENSAQKKLNENLLELVKKSSRDQKNIKEIQLLIKNGAQVTLKDDEGTSLLTWAILRENLYIVKLLIKHRVCVKIHDRDQESPLHIASRHGLNGIIKTLLDNGADINEQNKDGDTPLHLSLERPLTAKLLLEKGARANIQNNDKIRVIETKVYQEFIKEKIPKILKNYIPQLTMLHGNILNSIYKENNSKSSKLGGKL